MAYKSDLSPPGIKQEVHWTSWCTPGMGVNLWGESPLYVNPVNVLNILTKADCWGRTNLSY